MKNKIVGLLVLFILAVSCSTHFDETNENDKGSLVLSVSNNANARTIFAPDFALSDMQFTLSGVKDGKSRQVIKENVSYSNLIGEEVIVYTGTWDFTLVAYKNGIEQYSATLENVVVEYGINPLSFELKEASQAEKGIGEFSVSLSFPENSDVGIVKAALFTTELKPIFDYEPLSISNETTVLYKKTSVTSGIYIVSFTFFHRNGNEIKPGYSELIHIKSSRMSLAERTITDLENLRSIKYNLNGGGLKGSSLSASYNVSYGITLPTEEAVEKTGYAFSGWYESEAFKGEAIEKIVAGTNKDFVLWAKWTPINYTITYEGIEKATNSNPATYTIEDKISFVPPVSTTDDKVFIRWFSDGTKISGIPKGSYGDIVVTAKWRPAKKFSASDLLQSFDQWVSSLTGEDIPAAVMTGDFSAENLGLIANTLKKYPSTFVVLDLSETTGLIEIGAGAFKDCTSLVDVALPTSVTSIADFAFYNCTALESMLIPSSVTSIGYSAFTGCEKLSDVYAEDETKKCAMLVTADVSDLSPFLSDSTGIDTYYAFIKGTISYNGLRDMATILKANASKLINLDLSEAIGIQSIDSSQFSGCASLKGIVLPKSIATIERDAFSNCSFLEKIMLHQDAMTTIGSNAFNGCNKLAAVYTESIANWCGINFENSYSNPLYYAKHLYINNTEVTALEIPSGVTSISAYAFYNCLSLTSVKIPDTVMSIGRCAFYRCSNFTSVSLPKNLSKIGSDAFYDCYKLTAVYTESITSWCGINFEDSYSNPLHYAKHLYINDTEVTALEIPSGVTSISAYAFYNCSCFTSVSLPKSLSKIGTDAFYGCGGLTTVYVYDLVSWFRIDFGSAFSNPMVYATCFWVGNYNLTKTLKTIDKEKFLECADLVTKEPYKIFTAAEASVGLTSWLSSQSGDGPYYAIIVDKLTSSHLKSIASRIKSNSKYVCLDFSGTSGLEIFEDEVFKDCKTLEYVVIPDSVTKIGNGAFRSCTGLTAAIMMSGVAIIGDYAFIYCTNLAKVKIPSTSGDVQMSIGTEAFKSCENLSDVYYDGNLSDWCKIEFSHRPPSYYNYSTRFYESTNPLYFAENFYINGSSKVSSSLVIPSDVEEIKPFVFYGCKIFTSVHIPSKTSFIGYGAFKDCKNITRVTFENTSGWYYAMWQSSESGTALNVYKAAEVKEFFNSDSHKNKYLIRK